MMYCSKIDILIPGRLNENHVVGKIERGGHVRGESHIGQDDHRHKIGAAGAAIAIHTDQGEGRPVVGQAHEAATRGGPGSPWALSLNAKRGCRKIGGRA